MQRAIAIAILGVTLVPAGTALAGESHRTTPAPAPPPTGAQAPLVWDDLPGPQLEVAPHTAGIVTPAIPDFALPATAPGFRSPRELRVRGRPLLGTEVKVRGYVTWVYDCMQVLATTNPRASRGQIEAAVRRDPALCERPTFSLGDAADTSRTASIAVVAPDPKTRDRGAPQDDAAAAPPAISAGDYVEVTGRWSVPATATGGSGDGALVWSSVQRISRDDAPAGEPVAEPKTMEIELDTAPPRPTRKLVDDQTLDTSIEHMNACNRAIVARHYDTAIAECQTATTLWDGNHLAWYARAGAHMARREWQKAKEAAERAVTLRPDQAMYQLYYGIALYEVAHDEARGDPARRTAATPPRLDAARDALLAAVKRAPDLWRGHYYLGRIYRELDSPRRAAVQFTTTIKTNPAYRYGYIALIEIYRRWDYIDQALAVAMLGAGNVAAADSADLWFEVGIIHDTRRADGPAIEAFSRAIAARPQDAGARFERAQVYLRKGDIPSARRDLEDVARSTDPQAGVTKQLASELLVQLAGRRDGTPESRLPSWECSRQSISNTVECRRR